MSKMPVPLSRSLRTRPQEPLRFYVPLTFLIYDNMLKSIKYVLELLCSLLSISLSNCQLLKKINVPFFPPLFWWGWNNPPLHHKYLNCNRFLCCFKKQQKLNDIQMKLNDIQIYRPTEIVSTFQLKPGHIYFTFRGCIHLITQPDRSEYIVNRKVFALFFHSSGIHTSTFPPWWKPTPTRRAQEGKVCAIIIKSQKG